MRRETVRYGASVLCSWRGCFLLNARTISVSSPTSKAEAEFRSETGPPAGSSGHVVNPSLPEVI